MPSEEPDAQATEVDVAIPIAEPAGASVTTDNSTATTAGLAATVGNSTTTASGSMVPPTPTTLVHQMTTRLGANISLPKEYHDGTIRYPINRRTFSAEKEQSEPTDHVEALQDENWKQSMEEEYQALLKNETWRLVPPCQGIIDCK